MLRGIDPAREKDVTNIQKYMESGDLELKKDTVTIGRELSARLGLNIGDTISFISTKTAR